MFFKMSVTPHYFRRLQYRYYLSSKTIWTKMHRYLQTINIQILRINKRSRIKLIQNITFSLSFKIFELCNFCFEMHYLFVTKAERISERETLGLKSD